MMIRFGMTLLFVACAVTSLTSSGCGPSEVRAPKSDIEQAKVVLQDALEHWKAGKTADELRSATPPVYFADDAFAKKTGLSSYKILSSGEMYVTNVKFSVQLQLEGTGQSPREVSVDYLVTTAPALTITRQE